MKCDLIEGLEETGVEARKLGYVSIANEALEAAIEIKQLRDALKPFADYANRPGFDKLSDDSPLTQGSSMAAKQVTALDFKRARDAIGQKMTPEETLETVARALFIADCPHNMCSADWDSGAVLGQGNRHRYKVYDMAAAAIKAVQTQNDT